MNRLFEPYEIKGMRLKNRFVRSATFDGMATADCGVSPDQMALYGNLAAGGVGLIISCATCVSEAGRFYPNQNRLDGDDKIAGFARLAEAVHQGGGKLAVQLFHGGREITRRTGREGVAPSPGPDPRNPELVYRQITEDEIWQAVDDFGAAAARAREAGCDAVQIHGAHAFLFAQFLSPESNRRDDQWGGSLDNRLRFHREVLAGMRRAVGPDYPVMMKFGLQDGFEGGLELKEGLEAAAVLERAGCDCLEISQGLRGNEADESEFRTGLKPEEEGYFRLWAAMAKERLSIPVIAQGGVRSLAMAEEILERGEADMMALCRPLICEPELIARWRDGDQSRSRCISCNRCKNELGAFRTIRCFLEDD